MVMRLLMGQNKSCGDSQYTFKVVFWDLIASHTSRNLDFEKLQANSAVPPQFKRT